MRYKPYPAHETEDIVRVADSASVQHSDDGRKVMYVKAKCGEMLEIDISDKERPKEFKVGREGSGVGGGGGQTRGFGRTRGNGCGCIGGMHLRPMSSVNSQETTNQTTSGFGNFASAMCRTTHD